MTLTTFERARLRAHWRNLARAALTGDVAEVKAAASDAVTWAAPFEDPADAFVMFALARMVFAFSREKSEAGRQLRRPALSALAMLAGDVLDATDPAQPQPPPQGRLPYPED